MQERSCRAVDQRAQLVELEGTHVTQSQVEVDSSGGRLYARLFEHRWRGVDSDHSSAGGLCNRYCYSPGADRELDERPCERSLKTDIHDH